jgi:uncharacterized membrane protein
VSEFCSEKLRSLWCVSGLLLLLRSTLRSRCCAKVAIFAFCSCVVVVVATEVAIEILRKSCDLCVVFLCVCVLLLLRSNLRSRFCAKVATFVLDSCVCVVVLIAIELTIEILCKTCGFLCGGGGRACVRACLSFLI